MLNLVTPGLSTWPPTPSSSLIFFTTITLSSLTLVYETGGFLKPSTLKKRFSTFLSRYVVHQKRQKRRPIIINVFSLERTMQGQSTV
ncbi:hypothetical protein ABKN59_001637 [Abortiporus biennis]